MQPQNERQIMQVPQIEKSMQVSEARRDSIDRDEGEFSQERVRPEVARVPRETLEANDRLGNVPEMRDMRPIAGTGITTF